MKKRSLFATMAAFLMIAGLCACNKDVDSDLFDHFEIAYTLETNSECKECFETKWEILCDDTVVESDYFNTISKEGTLQNDKLVPNSTITFRTVPKFAGAIPADIQLMLKYDIMIVAVNKSGEVTDHFSQMDNRSYDERTDLSSPEDQAQALELFTVDVKVKTKNAGGKVTIEPVE